MSENFCPHCMQMLSGQENNCPFCGGPTEVTAAAHHLPVGTVLRSRNGHTFLFGKVKGEGGFGLTYIGKELTSGQLVAIKEYFPVRCQPQRHTDLSVHPLTQVQEIYDHGKKSFLSEASMLRAVDNIPSIVHVLDYFEANHTAYMVMEYLEGKTLFQMMQSGKCISSDMLIHKAIPLMRDMEKLHAAGVLHRDIAPDNIMWMPDGTLKLLDFGCARSLEDGRSMTVVLKPGFAPVEQYQTRGQGAYTDIYALCATLYYCMTGVIPPAAPERLTAIANNQPDPLVPPSAHQAAMSPEQEQILMWGLSLQPTIRPQNMKDMADRLEKATPVPKPPVTENDGGKKPVTETEIHTEDFHWTTDKVTTEQEPDGTNPIQSINRRKFLGAAVAAAIVVILVIAVLTLL